MKVSDCFLIAETLENKSHSEHQVSCRGKLADFKQSQTFGVSESVYNVRLSFKAGEKC